MNNGRLSRRRMLGGLSASVLGASLLHARPAGAQEASPEASPASGASAAFPVTIPHVYGETTIAAEPQRVVTLSWINQDAAIALGVIPVGMPNVAWGGDEEGVLPWTRTAIGENPLPVRFDDSAEIPYEEIVGLNPDVIIGAYSAITEEQYGILAEIAPTVAYPSDPFGTSWQDTTLIVGQALGKGLEAATLVSDTEALLAGAAVDYPQIAGKTFTYGSIDPAGGFSIYTTIDARVRLLSSLGMVPSPFVQSLNITDDPNAFFVSVSLEQAQQIDGDILILWFGTEDEADAAAALPLMNGVPAFANGAYAPIVGESNVMASSAPSPLSIPYILDTYVPQLAAAADNVPS